MRFLFKIFMGLCFFYSSFASSDVSEDIDTTNYIYEYIEPIPQKYKNRKRHSETPNLNQYKGDHSSQWYRRNDLKKAWYFSFNLNYSFFKDTAISIKHLSYPDAQVEIDEQTLSQHNSSALKLGRKGNLGFGFVLGYQKHKRLRYEFEIDHYKAEITDTVLLVKLPEGEGSGAIEMPEFSITPITFNILLNLSNSEVLIPYIGYGYGYASIGSSKEYDFFSSKQIKIGFNYNITDKITINLAYKKIDLGKIEYSMNVNRPGVLDQNYRNSEYLIEHEQNLETIILGYNFVF